MKYRILLLLVFTFNISLGISADEGMWTFDHVPLKQLQERYGFTPSQALLDHIRLSSVNIYASGGFVSGNGLILTNHHVALGAAQQLSTPEHNYVRDGFVAETLDKEIPIPGMTIRMLVSIEDVTSAVETSVKPGASLAEAKAQRDARITQLEADCLKKTGMKGEVVEFYGGAVCALYSYKEYTDIRLVFIPELQAAFFGGDDDNFTYPRYDLDVAMLRAYENGKPASTENHLEIDRKGAREGDLVFVAGHPGETDRLETYAMLEYRRDLSSHYTRFMNETRTLLKEYSARGPEEARRARTKLYFLENAIKSNDGEVGGLNDPKLMARKKAQEDALRAAVEKDPKLKQEFGGAWKEIEEALSWSREHEKELKYKLSLPFSEYGFIGTVLAMARFPSETAKPDGEREYGFHEAQLPDLVRDISTPSPVYKDLEETTLTYQLNELLKGLGPDDPFVRDVLQGKKPSDMAKEVIWGTKLDDAAYRGKLMAKNGKALAKCKDPLFLLAGRLEETFTKTQKEHRDRVEAVEQAALTKIAKAGFAVFGTDTYPDATGTLRLSFGKIAGYPQGSTLVPAFTTLYGLFDRGYGFNEQGDFYIPKRIKENEKELDLRTPYNFVCTADITGGSSGSPVVNKDGKLVGLVFDGNAQSHPNAFVYDEYQARCVAVDIRGILEILRKAYGSERLYREMTGE